MVAPLAAVVVQLLAPAALADLVLEARLPLPVQPLVLVVLAPVVAQLVVLVALVAAEPLQRLLSRQSFSAAMARSTP